MEVSGTDRVRGCGFNSTPPPRRCGQRQSPRGHVTWGPSNGDAPSSIDMVELLFLHDFSGWMQSWLRLISSQENLSSATLFLNPMNFTCFLLFQVFPDILEPHFRQ